jgi:hypothetical protein
MQKDHDCRKLEKGHLDVFFGETFMCPIVERTCETAHESEEDEGVGI